MPFDATPPAIRRIMHKPKDNSRYGDEIRAEEREKEGAERGGRGVVGAKNSYLKMYLPSGSQESPSAWKVRFLPFCFCFRVYVRACAYARVCVYVCESAYRFIRGDVEIVGGGRRYGEASIYPF